MVFVDVSFFNAIKIATKLAFPSLQASDIHLLVKYTAKYLNVFAILGNFEEIFRDDFKNEIGIYHADFTANGYDKLKNLIMYFLPHVKIDADVREISTLNDIYQKRANSDKKKSILESSPEYKFCNIQYDKALGSEEITFSEAHLENSYLCAVESLKYSYCKLFPNWRDIYPYDLSDYKSSSLFFLTKKAWDSGQIENFDDFLEDNNQSISSHHLYIGIIYDTISNFIFQPILKIKWLIYDVVSDSGESWPVYEILQILFVDFEKGWNTILLACKTEDLTINGAYFSGKNLNILIQSFLQGFARFYKEDLIKKIKENSVYEGFKNIDENKALVALRGALKHLRSIELEHFKEFYTNTFEKFTKTWFYSFKNFIKSEQIQNQRSHMSFEYTAKNFYNFCKSLLNSHYSHDMIYVGYDTDNFKNFARMPLFWRSLNKFEKRSFLLKINQNDYRDMASKNRWFDINGYIKNFLHISDNLEIDKISSDVFRISRKILLDGIFESLIVGGCLSYYYPGPNDNLKKKPGYHFGDSRPLKEKENFWKFQAAWNKRPTVGLVAQLGLSSKIHHQRIHFMTAGTGVGKSTVVPMLYLYFLKALMYLFDGRVVCTQPRIEPVNNGFNAVRSQLGIFVKEISTENKKNIMAEVERVTSKSSNLSKTIVDYLQDDNSVRNKANDQYEKLIDVIQNSTTDPKISKLLIEKIQEINKESMSTDNFTYLVQKEHSKEKPFLNKKVLNLKFVTDGKLLTELIHLNGKETINYNNNLIFQEKNMYDIIIIDEAHEHGFNMDIIISAMKHMCYHNNSLILVIMSATIESDEPIYRRFFRMIDDNMKYPIDTSAKIFLSNPQYTKAYRPHKTLDKNLLDRRIHVHAKSNHPVKEFYIPEKAGMVEDFVAEVMSKKKGIGLLFAPITDDITKSVEKLNEILPSNIIAVPFSSKVHSVINSIIKAENVLESIKRIKVPKKDIMEASKSGAIDKGNSSYTNCVFVSTNIAEASLTINGLEVVFDTGTVNVVEYDSQIRATISHVDSISYASQLQRRGRVGRNKPGTCYYFYKKGDKVSNAPKYAVSSSDLTYIILSFIRQNENEKTLLGGFDNDVNLQSFSLSNVSNLTLHNYIKKQYFLGGNNSVFCYAFDKNITKKLPLFYETGFDIATLVDAKGIFYVIHPEEPHLERNAKGDFIFSNNEECKVVYDKKTKEHFLYSIKMDTFIENLTQSFLVKNKKDKSVKTHFGAQVISCYKLYVNSNAVSVLLNEEDMAMIILCYNLDCLDEFLIYLSSQVGNSGDIIKLVATNYKKFQENDVLVTWNKKITQRWNDSFDKLDKANKIEQLEYWAKEATKNLETNVLECSTFIMLKTLVWQLHIQIGLENSFASLKGLIASKHRLQAAFIFVKTLSLVRYVEHNHHISVLFPQKRTIKFFPNVPSTYLVKDRKVFYMPVEKENLQYITIKIDESIFKTFLRDDKFSNDKKQIDSQNTVDNSIISLKTDLKNIKYGTRILNRYWYNISPEIKPYLI